VQKVLGDVLVPGVLKPGTVHGLDIIQSEYGYTYTIAHVLTIRRNEVARTRNKNAWNYVGTPRHSERN